MHNERVVQRLKRLLLPQGRKFRRVLFGPAAGAWLSLDLNHELRLYVGLYERELHSSYRNLLREGMKGFDIGGRDGYSALVIAGRTKAPVVSFECEAKGVAEMQQTFDRNDLPIRAVEAFVGSTNSPHTTITLDEAAAKYFLPDFIKIDVEGGEVDVLKGGEYVLSQHRPRMIIEVHGMPAELGCLEMLKKHKYEVEVVDQASFFREQRPIEHNRWLICTPAKAETTT